MLIWTAEKIFHGFPGEEYVLLENTTNLKQRLKLHDAVDLTILTVSYDSLASMIIMLIECTGCISTPELYLASYDEETLQWSLRDFSRSPLASGDIRLEILTSAKTSLVLWDDDTVYYTYQGTRNHGYLKLAGVDQMFSAANHSSSIHQIIVGKVYHILIDILEAV